MKKRDVEDLVKQNGITNIIPTRKRKQSSGGGCGSFQCKAVGKRRICTVVCVCDVMAMAKEEWQRSIHPKRAPVKSSQGCCSTTTTTAKLTVYMRELRSILTVFSMHCMYFSFGAAAGF